MSSLVAYCKKELAIAGFTPLDETQEDGPDKWIQENLLELAEVFSNQGHSGASAPFLLNTIEKLFAHMPLTPLTGADDEWEFVGDDLYQNKRCSSVFKNKRYGDAYMVNGYVFFNDAHLYYTSNCCSKKIKFPYTPSKPEYVKEGSPKYYWLSIKHKLRNHKNKITERLGWA